MIPSDFTFFPIEPDINNVALVKVYEEAYQNGADDMLEQFIDYLGSKGIEFSDLDNDAIVKIDMGDENSQWMVINCDTYEKHKKENYIVGFEEGYNEGRRFQNKTWEQYKLDENL